ncbi:hypothetical protein ABID22_000051 [Pontibacter aydingkolensis]
MAIYGSGADLYFDEVWTHTAGASLLLMPF